MYIVDRFRTLLSFLRFNLMSVFDLFGIGILLVSQREQSFESSSKKNDFTLQNSNWPFGMIFGSYEDGFGSYVRTRFRVSYEPV